MSTEKYSAEMKDLQNLGEASAERFGVPALAEEIFESLLQLPRWNANEIRSVRRRFTQRLEHAPAHVLLELAMLLLQDKRFVFRLVAYELLHYHPAAFRGITVWDLKRLGRGLDSWAAVDTFAVYLAGPLWRERRIPDSVIHDWARSEDRWWRRAALVSTVPLNSKARGGAGDNFRTLAICRLLVPDRDPMVVKSMSWALRELSKRDPRAVRRFVAEHKERLAPRVVREVRNKLAAGRKIRGTAAQSAGEK